MPPPTGLLFLNMGGPDGPADVRPFLTALFSDNDIIPLPLGPRGMRIFGWLFAALRAPYARKLYGLIGGGSPQRRVSERQGALVAERLEREAPGAGWRSYLALRYTPPSTDDAIRAMRRDGVERLFVVPLYPQFSSVTTGSSLAELARGFTRAAWTPREVHVVRDYHDDPAYLDALAGSVNRALGALSPEHRREAVVLFSAHALPLRVVERGDLYPDQVKATVAGAARRLAHEVAETRLAWQSQARPFTRWLEPKTDEVLVELGRAGKRTVVMVPIAFVQEHIETLYEMDILYGELAKEARIERFVRVPALGEDPAFVEALAGAVLRAAGGVRALEAKAAPALAPAP